MKRTFYSFALGLSSLTALSASAQSINISRLSEKVDLPSHDRGCATMEVFDRQLAEDPQMARRVAEIEARTSRFVANPMANRAAATGPVTIPVVVHVLYNNAAENVSDAQVQAQIDVLNQDFAKTNADAGLIPAAFAGAAASTNVRFALAQRDPSGRATNGIIHKSTRVKSWSTNDAMKQSKRGGDDAWDTSQYLNIWVCDLGNGLLGYAQFPGGSASTDGVVILYSSLPGGSAAPYNKGRTATHEVGHWLNLRHIWGDASCGNDLVSDTPTQQTSNYGCPTFPKVTCSNGPNGDMFMNYMDYTDDACMYMFSNGQSSRMDALFASGGARASLLNSTGGTTPLTATMAVETLTVFPNPTTGQLSIRTGLDTPAAGWQLKVYDLRGLEMPQARSTAAGSLDVSALPTGLYHLMMTNGKSVQHQSFRKE
ncbi:M43 family zinc metalloprotease [Hymenobacter psychrophilus]|uniref:Por secretion system C-terminal sorting domain-containing protein n=1 Tax=Hymenobacter psychrophilus TaxID=651662 RepID=A0A1H3EY02_9BACT|nr:M43 family zinc metalloprotease [Hymenobacter psychrophilus]SDX83682.1 Por secretion system C-terminal sorting domain-containing protein [Hymenobacter psychrophilus]